MNFVLRVAAQYLLPAVSLLAISPSPSLSQTLDSLNPISSGTIYAVALQTDSRIIIGGSFNTLGGISRSKIARLNPSGILDPSFNPVANSDVTSLALYPDGRILCGGQFTQLGGVSRNHVGRLNSDGSLDPTFNPNVNGDISGILLQQDGSIIVCGNFTQIGGQTRGRIARLDAGGALDPSFNPNADNIIYCAVRQPDGKIIVGGDFNNLAGGPCVHLGRLNTDGSVDATFQSSVTGSVYTCALQPDGRILVGGSFTSLAGQTATNLGRLNTDGSLDGTFSATADNTVYTLTLQADGKTLVGGVFGSLDNLTVLRLGRLNQNGSLDTNFNTSASSAVYSLALQSDGAVLAAGSFTSIAGQSRGSMARLNNTDPPVETVSCDGSTIIWSRGGTCPEIIGASFDVATNGLDWVPAGSAVSSAGTWQLTGLSLPPDAKVRARGSVSGGYRGDSSWFVEKHVGTLVITSPPFDRTVSAGQTATFSVTAGGDAPFAYQWQLNGTNLLSQTSSSLSISNAQWEDIGAYGAIVSNAHSAVTSAPAQLIVLHTAAADPWNPGANSSVQPMVLQPDGKLLVGGAFVTLAGQNRVFLGRFNTDGTLDTGFVPSIGNGIFVDALAVQTNGQIIIGGIISRIGSLEWTNLARLNNDGTLDATFHPSPDFSVGSLEIQPDGKILVGGRFQSIGGLFRTNVARLNPDGSLDTAFNASADSAVDSFAIQPDGKILVAGGFLKLNGQSRKGLGRLQPDGTLDTNFVADASSTVFSISLQPDGRIIVAGGFTNINGQFRSRIARLNTDGSLDPAFLPTPDDRVGATIVQTDGKILIGGWFSSIGGITCSNIARLNTDGTFDNTFNPRANAVVYSLVVSPDGSIFAGGDFTAIAGQSRNRLARLTNTYPASESFTLSNSQITWLRRGPGQEFNNVFLWASTNGADWLSVNPYRIAGGWQSPPGSVPLGATILGRGSLLLDDSHSYFETAAGPPGVISQPISCTNNAATLARFMVSAVGTPPFAYQWCKEGIPLANTSTATGLQSPSLVLSNVFGADAGSYSVNISNSYGMVTSAPALLFVKDPFIVSSPSNQFRLPGQTANFSVSVAGTPPFSYQWRHYGTNIDSPGASNLILTSLARQDAGYYDVIVSNVYSSATSSPALLTVNLSTLDGWAPNANGTVIYSLSPEPSGKIVVGGDFNKIGGQSQPFLARLNEDGSLDSSFAPSIDLRSPTTSLLTDGKVLIGGAFSLVNNEFHGCLLRLNHDGTTDSSFFPTPNGPVNAGLVQADQKIVLAGTFTKLGNQTRPSLGRVGPDGAIDSGFSPGAATNVLTLAFQTDGSIIAGGSFTGIGGQQRNRIARIGSNGVLDSFFNPGADQNVNCFAVQPDGKILIGGKFVTIAGQNIGHLTRLNANGTLDTSFKALANSDVNSIVLQTDGKIVIGGNFNSFNGAAVKFLVRVFPDGSIDSTFNPAPDWLVSSLALQADGRLLIGGSFTNVQGQLRTNVARLNNTDPATQVLNFDGSTVTWTRTGTSPEVSRTTFEICTNGIDWNLLGAGSRIANGWQFSGVTLATNATIRARGFLNGGYFNVSGWFVESTLVSAPGGAPVILVNDPSFGLQSNQFGFKLAGNPGQVVVIEASADLISWIPIVTNNLSTVPLYFADPEAAALPARFYRLRVQ